MDKYNEYAKRFPMNKNCPQYPYTFEEQKERFPLFDDDDYNHGLEWLQFVICECCKADRHSKKCPYDKKSK